MTVSGGGRRHHVIPGGTADADGRGGRACAELSGEKHLGRAGQFRLHVLCRLLRFCGSSRRGGCGRGRRREAMWTRMARCRRHEFPATEERCGRRSNIDLDRKAAGAGRRAGRVHSQEEMAGFFNLKLLPLPTRTGTPCDCSLAINAPAGAETTGRPLLAEPPTPAGSQFSAVLAFICKTSPRLQVHPGISPGLCG